MSTSEDIPCELPERTGRHLCIVCLADTPAAVFFANDHLCDACAAREEYPLASTPAPAEAEAAPRKRGSGAK